MNVLPYNFSKCYFTQAVSDACIAYCIAVEKAKLSPPNSTERSKAMSEAGARRDATAHAIAKFYENNVD